MPVHTKTFFGFGFGPIQSALFLYEAFRSGRFSRFVIAEVDASLVQAVRSSGGRYTINIALPERIEQATVSGVELYNPTVSEDRERILQAIAESDELATSLPSVAFFDKGGQTSVAHALADGFARRSSPRPTDRLRSGEPQSRRRTAPGIRDEVLVPLPPSKASSSSIPSLARCPVSSQIPQTIAKLNLATLTPTVTQGRAG
jgi:hypothetical protein